MHHASLKIAAQCRFVVNVPKGRPGQEDTFSLDASSERQTEPPGMRVHGDRIFSLNLTPEMRTEDVKEEIEKKAGISAEWQRLFIGRKELPDGDTIGDRLRERSEDDRTNALSICVMKKIQDRPT